MVKKELHFVYITSDGSKFLHEAEANFWQEHLDRVDEQILKQYEMQTETLEDVEAETNKKDEEEKLWRQTKAKQRAIDLKDKS